MRPILGVSSSARKNSGKKMLDTPPGDGYIPIPAEGAAAKSGLLFDNWKAGAGHSKIL